ncbi:hypothetical protein TPHA_0P01680 [Tetrapisispora phaffii CBS 4417]|uniref:UBZ4-type domain-containing protein n=1 Tax=Tetrapisispora phaffii (strain ATCC 24235 / CBS 4417 / NBRC 1672 / NRRL Y-8282 / UCD 70-5) TaxID=1071381 RepID=G8C2E8_TETPH|nr:hypothetical protein TPHA_0P01680 [Tetrapisispora phaffii CBS 4417]CCE66326.1 hypothetical protein TPHA_0P01680 [Tetrapisispora phaffii CBS 4417]
MSSKKNVKSEQLISCPVCNKKIKYSIINAHLDKCTDKFNSGNDDSKEKNSVMSILGGFKSRKRVAEVDVVDLEKTSSTNETTMVKEEVSPHESAKKLQIGAVTKQNYVSNSPHLSTEYESKRLQKISHLPLSEKLRPHELKDYVGQQHLMSKESGILARYITEGQIPSMILWGPPGVGKTTLARIITKAASESNPDSKTSYQLVEVSATKTNSQELRSIFEKSRNEYKLTKRRIVLFIDELHRFNKAQQDLLLPHIENGDIILIGATTENPSFQMNNALISRCNVFVLEKLSTNEICIVLSRGVALLNKCRKLLWHTTNPLKLSRMVLEYIVNLCVGDTRKALNILEMIELSTRDVSIELTVDSIKDIMRQNTSESGVNSYYDRNGDNHYDTISALHKAVRGGDANAALLYLGRMLQGGEDPLYIARRMIRMASEDIGVADSSLLTLAVSTHDAVMKIGLPECDVILAHCCVELARAKKSVEVYRAYNKVKTMLKENTYSLASSEIPMHIRNAPTKLMKELGYHKGYKYNPDFIDGKVKQEYFPTEVLDQCLDKKELNFLTGEHLGSRYDNDLVDNDEVKKKRIYNGISYHQSDLFKCLNDI